MPASRPAGSSLGAWERHAPTLTRLFRKLERPVRVAFRESRPDRFAWPALVLALIDIVLRKPALGSLISSHALDYAARVLLMAVLWGAIGGALCLSLRARRPASFAAVPLAASAVSLLCLSVMHLAYFLINGDFATPQLLRSIWTVRSILLGYLAGLPAVTFTMLFAVVAGFSGLLTQAIRRAKATETGGRGGAWLCLALGIFAGSSITSMTADSASLELAPPDAASLGLLSRAALEPANVSAEQLRGAFRRLPLPVPPLTRAGRAGNVLVILTESVRADALCSDPQECRDEYLDPPAADRVGFSQLRSQSPGTFTTCMVLWTGLEPDTEYPASHRAPLLWEVARAAGYHTIYVTAQSPDFLDFGRYISVAGIDHLVTATDLELRPDVWVGADDEKAMAAFASHVAKDAKEPWYGVLHLSNTHATYRTDPNLQPHRPQSRSLNSRDLKGVKNRYLNAIALQRRSLGAFLRQLRSLPSWPNTTVLFLSDHGEPLGDHGKLLHRDDLFESSMRVPGFALAGKDALSAEQRQALATNRRRFLYTRDIHATVLDALGVWDQRGLIPYAELRAGRSLLREMPSREPIAPLSNISGVWALARPHYGVAQGDRKLIAEERGPFFCYDLDGDPGEEHPQAASACGPELLAYARLRFPQVRDSAPPAH